MNNKNMNFIIEGLNKKEHEEQIKKDKWVTINGVHAEVDDNGVIKDEKLRKKIEANETVKEDKELDEDKWITIKGTHVLTSDDGEIKNEKLKKKIEATEKK